MIKLGYLISQYPAVSHTFIMREILYLREHGFKISVASINKPGFSSKPTSVEQQEASQTYYVKETPFIQILTSLLKTMIFHPVLFFKGFFFAIYLNSLNIKQMMYGVFYFIEAILIGEWMKSLNLSHLHVHFANPASQVGLILTKIFPYTYSITVHGPDEFSDVTLNCLKEKTESAQFVCCISHYAQSQLMRLTSPQNWNKLRIAPLGVDPKEFNPITFRENPSPFQILCVGRLVPAKGQYVLLAALEILISQGRNISLKFIGEGSERKILEQEVAKRGLQSHVIFTGALNFDDVLKAYEQTDIFVLPSFAEGIPVSLMEAMAMEIPCISTSVNGISELILTGNDGLLVAPADTQGLATAIATLIDHPDERLRIGKAGREHVEDKYNFSKNIKVLIELFKEYLSSKSDEHV